MASKDKSTRAEKPARASRSTSPDTDVETKRVAKTKTTSSPNTKIDILSKKVVALETRLKNIEKSSETKRKRVKDPDAKKKPPNNYISFGSIINSTIKSEFPEVTNQKHVICYKSELWSVLKDEVGKFFHKTDDSVTCDEKEILECVDKYLGNSKHRKEFVKNAKLKIDNKKSVETTVEETSEEAAEAPSSEEEVKPKAKGTKRK